MADAIKLTDGSIHVVFDLKGFMELVDTHLGDEARSWLEEYLSESDDNDEYIDDLETELKGVKDHHREVMEELRRQAETSQDSSGKRRLTGKSSPRLPASSEASHGGS